jgi:hypothetical protein
VSAKISISINEVYKIVKTRLQNVYFTLESISFYYWITHKVGPISNACDLYSGGVRFES